VLVHRLLARGTIEERLVELIEEKARLFTAYAHDSAVRDASTMAVDSGDGVTMEELRKFL
jgi:SNF2 family DNA or RNA helicase